VPVNCPAPPQGGGKPHWYEWKRFTSECPAAPQGGGKPRPYYTRAWQADLAGYVSLLLISAEVSKVC